MTPEEYFNKEYGKDHIKTVIEMNDMVSLYGLMQEYTEKQLAIQRVSGSYLVITKEHYSDGVKEIYEREIKASSLDEAKEEASKYVDKQNNYLRPEGMCYLVDVMEI